MYLEKKFHKYSVVIFDLLINNRFLKNQECVFINFDLWQKKILFCDGNDSLPPTMNRNQAKQK